MKEKTKQAIRNLIIIIGIVFVLVMMADIFHGNPLSLESIFWASFLFVPMPIALFLTVYIYSFFEPKLITDWKIIAGISFFAPLDLILQINDFYQINWFAWLPISTLTFNNLFFPSLILFLIEVGILVLIIKLYRKFKY